MSNILLKSEEIDIYYTNELDCLLYIDDQSYDPRQSSYCKRLAP